MSAPPSHPTTLFVRNLSHQITNTELSAHFSSIGPLRRALIVTDDATGLCKGFGFVHFALAEDAATALSRLNGSFLRGRKLNLHIAKPRQRSIKDGDGGLLHKEKNHNHPRRGAGLKGAVGMRTVLVRSTEGGAVEEDDVTQRLKKVTAAESATILPGPNETRVMFDTWAMAGKAASVLHGGGWDACVEALRGGKRTRLIVRNLPFRCSVAEVRAAFEKFAPVRELRLEPAKNPRQQRLRKDQGGGETPPEKKGKKDSALDQGDMLECAGFGFIEYFLVADAKFAMSKMNGAKIGGRVVAVDVSVGKSLYAKQLQAEQDDDDQEADPSAESPADSGAESVSGGNGGNESEAEDAENDFVTDSGSKDLKAEREGASDAKSAESSPEELARTVFVRNLLFETSAPELWTAMANEFGPVEQAVIVKHPVTQRPRGTAFVRFKRPEDADKAIARGGSGDTSKTRSAVAQSAKEGFMLQGRALLITKAVDRKKARDIDLRAKMGGKKVDPRNLRLAWVGQVKPGSAEARGLSERDMERREKSGSMKRMTLSKNPNTFVSDVRLSVKNLPKEFTDVMLKQMFLAVVEREMSKEKGEKGKEEGGKSKTDGEGKMTEEKRAVRITHCKIVRDDRRNGRSKGYGFVTFERHEDALTGLHGVNNKDDVLDVMIKAKRRVLKLDEGGERYLRERWGNGRRLDVEFSVEDQRSVRVIEGIKERGRKKAEENRKRKLEEGGGGEKPKRRRKNRRKEVDREEGTDKSGVETKKVSRAEKKSAMKRKRAAGQEEAKLRAVKDKDGEATEESGAGTKKRRSERRKSAGYEDGLVVEGEGRERRKRGKRGGESASDGDSLVFEAGVERRRKRGKKGGGDGGGKRDKLDALVEAYKKKLTKGPGKMAVVVGEAGSEGAELKRWFA